jgi:hypothetical protein
MAQRFAGIVPPQRRTTPLAAGPVWYGPVERERCRGDNRDQPKMKMMTTDDIRTELGWTDSMIHSLLQDPDSPHARRDKHTGGYTYGLYRRERVLAVAQSTEGRLAKRRWDETLRGTTPNPGWTTRLGDIGRQLCITAVATGRLLERLGYRSDKHVTDAAVAAGCGVRRWDGFAMHDDWHVDRAVAAIRSAAQVPGDSAVADALAAAVGRQEGRERLAARKREQEEKEAARRQEEDAVVFRYRLSCGRYAVQTLE